MDLECKYRRIYVMLYMSDIKNLIGTGVCTKLFQLHSLPLNSGPESPITVLNYEPRNGGDFHG